MTPEKVRHLSKLFVSLFIFFIIFQRWGTNDAEINPLPIPAPFAENPEPAEVLALHGLDTTHYEIR